MLRIPNLQVKYSPDKVPLYREAEIIGNRFHPRRPKYVALIQNTPSDILRWSVSTDISAKVLPLSTQRNRLRRRWAGAITTALHERGLDSHGKRLPQGREVEGRPLLAGTMEITVHAGYGFDESADVLAKKSGEVVDALLRSGIATQRSPRTGAGDGARMNRWKMQHA